MPSKTTLKDVALFALDRWTEAERGYHSNPACGSVDRDVYHSLMLGRTQAYGAILRVITGRPSSRDWPYAIESMDDVADVSDAKPAIEAVNALQIQYEAHTLRGI